MAETTTNNSIGFAGLLTILFIALKLTGVITWSWVWVLCPLWIGIALGLVIITLVVIIGVLVTLIRR